MTKNEFKLLAKERGVVHTKYSGNQKTMFLWATNEVFSAFKHLCENINVSFKIKHEYITNG
jgi:hypothetical protein